MSTGEKEVVNKPEAVRYFFDFVGQEYGDKVLLLCKQEVEKTPNKNLPSILNEVLQAESQSQKATPSIGGMRFNSD